MARRSLNNTDAAERTFRLQILSWAFAAGLLMGGLGGGALAGLVGALLGFVIVAALVYVVATWAVRRARDLAQIIYNPSGGSTPYRTQYSYAASLAVRGRHAEAAAAYELHVIEHPAEPEPYLQLARLYRDKLQRYDEALTWLRRARSDATLGPGQELFVIQEIIELYIHKLRTPRKAIPELTLVCQRFAGTPAARAAERDLADMRELLARERDGLEPFTEEFLKRLDRSSITAAAIQTRSEIEDGAVRAALRECGNDAGEAAQRLGVTVEQLQEKMRQLGIA